MASKGHKNQHKTLSLSYEPTCEGMLVMSGKEREKGQLDMLHCVVLLVVG